MTGSIWALVSEAHIEACHQGEQWALKGKVREGGRRTC